MPDIRQRVQEDQGVLKRIQNFVPGFRGYRKREDLRDADRMLRSQIAQELGKVRKALEDSRSLVAGGWNSRELELMGGVIAQLKKVEGKVLHAETGYSGFVADIEVKEDEIYRLYDHDANMLDMLNDMHSSVDNIRSSLISREGAQAQNDILQMRTLINNFEMQFERRLKLITGTEV
ncbi:MAG: hypothetical protein GX307_03465 [Euryarchaeota archaeon]|nr:hypothetical protein [Euryarchaeota archaeon]